MTVWYTETAQLEPCFLPLCVRWVGGQQYLPELLLLSALSLRYELNPLFLNPTAASQRWLDSRSFRAVPGDIPRLTVTTLSTSSLELPASWDSPIPQAIWPLCLGNDFPEWGFWIMEDHGQLSAVTPSL